MRIVRIRRNHIMEENQNIQVTEQPAPTATEQPAGEQPKGKGGVRKLLKVLALFCIIFVFTPSFLVSCSGEVMKINVFTAVGGVSLYGEKVVKAHPIMLLCLLIPLAALVLLFVKKFTEKNTALYILCGMAVDFIMFCIFKRSAKKLATESFCTFKTTGWYVLNMICLLLIIILCLLVFIGKLSLDGALTTLVNKENAQNALNQASAAWDKVKTSAQDKVDQIKAQNNQAAQNGQPAQPPKDLGAGFCSACGAAIIPGSKFCTVCGAKLEIKEDNAEVAEAQSEANAEVEVAQTGEA